MNIDYLLMAHGFGGKKSKDKIPPPNVIGFSASTVGNDIKLTWANPKDSDFVGLIIVRREGSFPVDVNDGVIVFKGLETSYIDKNVAKAKYLYYRAFACDFDNNINTEESQTARALVKGSQETPSVPTLSSKGYDSVTLEKNTGYEYKVDNGNWQDSNAFNNLRPDTNYTFYQRKKGNKFYNPSNSSSGLSLTTLKPPYQTMTAIIDQTNSNPLTCIDYADDANGMTKGSSEWDEFFGTKLVLFKGGKEVRDLEDAELNSLKPEDGDVMVKFKRMGLNIKTVGNKVYVSMTDNPNDSNFKYYAHSRGTTRKEAFYLGAYLGYEIGGKLRSVKGVMPSNNKTIGAFRTLAQANGSGYEQFAFYQLVFLQAMYILKYGNLDSQTAIGKGLTSGNYTNTGTTNGKGIDFGSTNATLQMRFQYLEDFYGNKYQWIDGVRSGGKSDMTTTTDGFNDNGQNYKPYPIGFSDNVYQYPKKVQGTSELGFIIKENGASQSTYFCDYQDVYGNSVYFPCFGGNCSKGANAGAFYVFCSYSASNASSTVGSRLMFL